MKKNSQGMSYNPTWFHEINPLRLENIEDIHTKHEIENIRLHVNMEKLSDEQKKNNLR